MVIWDAERNVLARSIWCNGNSTLCPTRLSQFMRSRVEGKTMTMMDESVTLTVLGSRAEREFACRTLKPVLIETVQALTKSMRRRPKVVHVTYCDVCGDRILPDRAGSLITSEHVNGGISMGDTMGVLVFRRQDAVKVMIHELLHMFEVDKALQRLTDADEQHVIRARQGLWQTRQGMLGTRVALSEAYTDAIACIMFSGSVLRARRHAIHAAKVMLAYFGWGSMPFKESTHAFSYYVVKAAMLVHSEELIMLVRSQTDGVPMDVKDVVRFMERSLRSTRFSEVMRSRWDKLLGERRIEMTDGKPAHVQLTGNDGLI